MKGNQVFSYIAYGLGIRSSLALPEAADQSKNTRSAHSRLIPEHQHEHIAPRVDRAERGRDRRGAALAERGVLDNLHPAEVHPGHHVRTAPADHAQQLIERTCACDPEHVIEQSPRPVRQELLRAPEP